MKNIVNKIMTVLFVISIIMPNMVFARVNRTALFSSVRKKYKQQMPSDTVNNLQSKNTRSTVNGTNNNKKEQGDKQTNTSDNTNTSENNKKEYKLSEEKIAKLNSLISNVNSLKENVVSSCGGIANGLSKVKGLAGTSATISTIGTGLATGALVVGMKRTEKIEETERQKKLEEEERVRKAAEEEKQKALQEKQEKEDKKQEGEQTEKDDENDEKNIKIEVEKENENVEKAGDGKIQQKIDEGKRKAAAERQKKLAEERKKGDEKRRVEKLVDEEIAFLEEMIPVWDKKEKKENENLSTEKRVSDGENLYKIMDDRSMEKFTDNSNWLQAYQEFKTQRNSVIRNFQLKKAKKTKRGNTILFEASNGYTFTIPKEKIDQILKGAFLQIPEILQDRYINNFGFSMFFAALSPEEKLGHRRTGLMAGAGASSFVSLATSGSGASDAGKMYEKMLACNKAVSELKKANSVLTREIWDIEAELKANYVYDREYLKVADATNKTAKNIVKNCKNFETKDISVVKNILVGSSLVSSIGTVTSVAGAITSGFANSKKVEKGSDKQKQLDLASNVMAGITIGTSASSTVLSASAALKLGKKLIEQATECEKSFDK